MTATEPAEFRPPPVNAAAARAHVRELLLAHDPGTAAAVVDDVLIVVTELITNAQRHGGGLTGFDARLDGDTIAISVSDASPVAPHTAPHSDAATPGGFGWPMIRRLGRQVTVTPTGPGKTIRVVVGTGAGDRDA